MQILIPFAAPPHPDFQNALQGLELPHLRELLQRLTVQSIHHGSPEDLTPLHERLPLVLQGHTPPDGLTGAAACAAQERGLYLGGNTTTQQSWAFITLCHWDVHTHTVHMADPQQLHLSQQESDTLLQTMQPYFADDGVSLHPYQTGTWLAQGAVLHQLPTASLYRVRGQSVDGWIPRQAQAKALRRLQNEMQMLLYTHPVNDARAQRGAPVVNSFWISGTGAPLAAPRSSVKVLSQLEQPTALHNIPGWCAGWNEIDHTLRSLLTANEAQQFQMTLCGEQRALTFAYAPLPWWKALQRRLQKTPVYTALLPLFAS